MAHEPTAPKALQIMERIKTVLQQIEASEDYFYTPFRVDLGYNHLEKAEGWPYYVVYRGEPAGTMVYAGQNQWDEDFNVTIEGVVHSDTNTVQTLERAITDVRKAINEDSKGEAGAGSLGDGVLTVDIRFEEPPSAELGIVEEVGFGFFVINCRVIMSGDIGEI